jgi:hypothetical protein
MRRVGVVLAVALPLAVVDLWWKSAQPTEPWAYHERSGAWLLLSLFLVAAMVIVTRIPAVLVPPAAGVLAGGLLGNAMSASWNEMKVPNPIVVKGEHTALAFNLADVWSVAGILLLVTAIGVWLIRNRTLLLTPAQARARWRSACGRRR